MRILEAEQATLTDVEVYTFLKNQEKQYKEQKRRGPPNLEGLRGEMIKYFETNPVPLSQKPQPFDVSAIPVLLEKLRPFKINKGECTMLLNIRPTTVPALNAVLEDIEERFDEDKMEAILNIIIEVLGQFPPEEGEGDAMETGE